MPPLPRDTSNLNVNPVTGAVSYGGGQAAPAPAATGGGRTAAGTVGGPPAGAAPAASTPATATTPAGATPPSAALAALEHWLPPQIVNQVKGYFGTGAPASTQLAYAMQSIQQTPWYAQTFPAIQQGIQQGLFSNEQGYIQHRDQLNQVYQQYTGKSATSAQIAHSVTQGFSVSRVAQGLSGEAYLAANKPEITSTLGAFGTGAPVTQPQLQALALENAPGGGIDTPLGQLVQKRLAQAQERMKGVFSGTLATPSLSLATGRIAGNQGISPDTAA